LIEKKNQYGNIKYSINNTIIFSSNMMKGLAMSFTHQYDKKTYTKIKCVYS